MKPHKHAAVIKAWADGARVQVRIPKAGRLDNTWEDIEDETMYWYSTLEYRVKPEPKPDIVKRVCLELVEGSVNLMHPSDVPINLILSFDGETEKLKSAEVISS